MTQVFMSLARWKMIFRCVLKKTKIGAVVIHTSMVSASTIADVELKLSSMENGKSLIDALNNKSK